MNAKTRKQIEKYIETIENVKSEIEDIQSDEECKFDNMPEGLQESERGEAMQEAIDYLTQITEG